MKKRKYTEAQKVAAQTAYDDAARVMKAHDALDRIKWDAAPNPFIAWAQFSKPAARAERAAVIEQWRTAREHLALVRGTTVEKIANLAPPKQSKFTGSTVDLEAKRFHQYSLAGQV